MLNNIKKNKKIYIIEIVLFLTILLLKEFIFKKEIIAHINYYLWIVVFLEVAICIGISFFIKKRKINHNK